MKSQRDNSNSGSYIEKAEKEGDCYFSMGNKWSEFKETLKLSDEEMFELFNACALDRAIDDGKVIRLCDDPRTDGSELSRQMAHLQKRGFYVLMRKGDYWYAERQC